MTNNQHETCPICGKEAEEKYIPFCSKRCADIDLNRWFSGKYAIPVEETSAEINTENTAD